MQKLINLASPFLAILGLPLLFWPTVILIIALVKQAKAQMILRPKHIAIFIGVQVIWLIVLFAFSYFLILRPLHLRF
jgi:hypothetical protein